MKLRDRWKKSTWAPYATAACVGILFYVVLTHLGIFWKALQTLADYFKPVLGGVILAYILDAPVRLLEQHVFFRLKNKKTVRILSVICVWAVAIGLLVVLLTALIPQLISSIMRLVNNFGLYSASLERLLRSLASSASNLNVDISGLTDFGASLLEKLTAMLPATLNSLINTSLNIGSMLFNGLIACILSIYFLIGKQSLLNGFRHLFSLLMKESSYRTFTRFLSRCNKIMIRFVAGDLVDGFLVALINFIFMRIAGLPYSALVSVVVGITNLAPTFGPIAGGAIGAFILVLVNPWYALWFLIFTFVLQTADGYYIKPRLFGNSLGVSSVWILIMLIICGRMLGVAGILLAIPAAAILQFIYLDVFLPHLEARRRAQKQPEEAEKSAQQASPAAPVQQTPQIPLQQASQTPVQQASQTPVQQASQMPVQQASNGTPENIQPDKTQETIQ